MSRFEIKDTFYLDGNHSLFQDGARVLAGQT